MNIQEVLSFLETLAPSAYQESYDNAGLLTGDPSWEINGILFCLDSTEEIIEEAKANNCNLIIAHHPIIFSGLKKINGKTYVERTIIQAIKNDIAIFAIHTNLDNVYNGVNQRIAQQLELMNTRILRPKGKMESTLISLPTTYLSSIKEKLQDPQIAILQRGEQVQINFPTQSRSKVMNTIQEYSPGMEIPRIPIENKNLHVGSGMLGSLKEDMTEGDFLAYLKEKMELECIRHTAFTGKMVNKVALCGGSGSFLLNHAIANKADVYISADFKYHEFFDAEGQIMIADIGHFESEKYTIDLLYEAINQKFSNFALFRTKINTNPINYYT